MATWQVKWKLEVYFLPVLFVSVEGFHLSSSVPLLQGMEQNP